MVSLTRPASFRSIGANLFELSSVYLSRNNILFKCATVYNENSLTAEILGNISYLPPTHNSEENILEVESWLDKAFNKWCIKWRNDRQWLIRVSNEAEAFLSCPPLYFDRNLEPNCLFTRKSIMFSFKGPTGLFLQCFLVSMHNF